MNRWLLSSIVCGSAACNPAFAIDPTALREDAGAPPDFDQDGVPDSTDNCPEVANDQLDEDQDGRGDACDNCILIANPGQETTGDLDPVGDACDAHPETDGDCFIFADTFGKPGFAQRWDVVLETTGMMPVIAEHGGIVDIAPVDDSTIAIVAHDRAQLAGAFDVIVVGRVTVTTGELLAMSRLSSPTSGIGCGIGYWGAPYVDVRGSFFAGMSSSILMSPFSTFGERVGTDTTIRLKLPSAVNPATACRVDHATTVGVDMLMIDPALTPPDGTPGIKLRTDPVALDGIAAYRFQPGTPCPAPILY